MQNNFPSAAASTVPFTVFHHPRKISVDAAIDDGLVRRFADNDETAFVEIMSRHRARIFTASLNLLRNRADAEEITQDTFIRAHRALATFRGDCSLATWLYRIAVNLSRNRYWYFFRRHRQDTLSLDVPIVDGKATFSDLMADERHNPSQQAALNEFSGLVDRCMRLLDAPHREVLTLRNVLNKSYDEIAISLGIKVGTVKSRIARAREVLRRHIAELCPEFSVDAREGSWLENSYLPHGTPRSAHA